MDLYKAIQDLYAEKEKLERVIASLEELQRTAALETERLSGVIARLETLLQASCSAGAVAVLNEGAEAVDDAVITVPRSARGAGPSGHGVAASARNVMNPVPSRQAKQ